MFLLHLRRLYDKHSRSDGRTLKKVNHVGIDEAKAAGRHGMSDHFRLVGPLNAVAFVTDVDNARAERIARPARHEFRKFGMARAGLRRRCPIRPLALA
jgi:hypothetical protein